MQSLAAVVLGGILSSGFVANDPPSSKTVEGAILKLANTADAKTLAKAIKMGWVQTNLTNAAVRKEAEEVVAHRLGQSKGKNGATGPFKNLKDLYMTFSVGPESMEGLERYVRQYSFLPKGSPTLNFVNKRSTKIRVMTDKAGLDYPPAFHIWNAREGGKDGHVHSADDEYRPFNRIFGEHPSGHEIVQFDIAVPIHALDAVDGVDAHVIQMLCNYAVLKGY